MESIFKATALKYKEIQILVLIFITNQQKNIVRKILKITSNQFMPFKEVPYFYLKNYKRFFTNLYFATKILVY